MIFLDSSVAVHAAGSIGYTWAVQVFQAPPGAGSRLITDALCLQEVTEALAPVCPPPRVRAAVTALQAAVDEVVALTPSDFETASRIAEEVPALSPRECCHVAVMRRTGVTAVCSSWETGYREVQGLRLVYMLNDPRLVRGE